MSGNALNQLDQLQLNSPIVRGLRNIVIELKPFLEIKHPLVRMVANILLPNLPNLFQDLDTNPEQQLHLDETIRRLINAYQNEVNRSDLHIGAPGNGQNGPGSLLGDISRTKPFNL